MFSIEEVVPEFEGQIGAKEVHRKKKTLLSRRSHLCNMLVPLPVLISGSDSKHLVYEFSFISRKRFRYFLSSNNNFLMPLDDACYQRVSSMRARDTSVCSMNGKGTNRRRKGGKEGKGRGRKRMKIYTCGNSLQ